MVSNVGTSGRVVNYPMPIRINATGGNINILSEKTFGYTQTRKILLKDGLQN